MRPLMTRLELKATILQACKNPMPITAISKACGYQSISTTVETCVQELIADRKLEVLPVPNMRGNPPKALYRTVNQ